MPIRSRAKFATEASRGASVLMESAVTSGSGAESVRAFLKRLRSYRNVLTVLFVFLLIYSQRHWLVAWVDHPIEEIVINGDMRYLSQTEIAQKLQSVVGASFMLTDLEEVKRSAESLPWVASARITRLWPAKFQIDVVEQTPIVRWNAVSFLNPRGDVFTPEQGVGPNDLVSLRANMDTSLAQRQEMLATLAETQSLLEDAGFALTVMEQDARGTWTIWLENGPRVALGAPPFDEKIERLAQVWEYTPGDAKQQIEAIDTRYPNGVAVKWQEASFADSKDVANKSSK
ncbi:MAG: FtsQ-type POTRA domain-containing protein [Oleiphilaceae bacterium]|nr:FtsQ-type POTRA domain-containing protein [Oleiphilaceae bacterium]